MQKYINQVAFNSGYGKPLSLLIAFASCDVFGRFSTNASSIEVIVACRRNDMLIALNGLDPSTQPTANRWLGPSSIWLEHTT
ncbi:hypothetical protein TMatcc_000320 [Talaromyces marneffei ATCC 18224]